MNSKPVLALSLVLNLALAVAIAWLVKSRPAASGAGEAVPQNAANANKAHSSAKPSTETPAAAPAKPIQSFDWRMVESEDYKKYIANLRAIGCPEETIRDIITADVNKLFESRRKELNAGGKKFEFWKAGNPFATMMDADKMAKQQKLALEKRELLTELLGVAPEEKFDMFAGMNPFESMLDFLPADKQNKVMQMYQDMQVKMMKQFKDGAPDAEDMKNVQKAQKEMEAELAKILSPQEFEDFQLRMSQTAMTMRMQLAGFEPSEQEFRDVFKLKKKFDDEFGLYGMGTLDKAEREKRDATKKEMDAQLKNILGETRFADYERSQDYAYQGIAKVAERNNLGKDAAIKVYDMKKLAEEQARNLRNDKSLTSEQRTAALQGIRTETENSIRTVFGDKAYESYQKQPGAYWLKNISPDAKTETKTSKPVQTIVNP